MDLNTIAIADFKDQFVRDFPYLPEWDALELYNTGDEVYYSINQLFYRALTNGIITTPPPNVNWENYQDDIFNYVLDSDITRAFAEAQMNLNQSLFGTDDQIKLGYLYLTAHYLVHDLRAAKNGIEASGNFPVSSRSVGSVSESYAIPANFASSATLSFYTTTPYGLKYLSFIQTKLRGNVVGIQGWTTP